MYTYTCIYAYMYIYMYVYMYIYMHVCMTYACIRQQKPPKSGTDTATASAAAATAQATTASATSTATATASSSDSCNSSNNACVAATSATAATTHASATVSAETLRAFLSLPSVAQRQVGRQRAHDPLLHTDALVGARKASRGVVKEAYISVQEQPKGVVCAAKSDTAVETRVTSGWRQDQLLQVANARIHALAFHVQELQGEETRVVSLLTAKCRALESLLALSHGTPAMSNDRCAVSSETSGVAAGSSGCADTRDVTCDVSRACAPVSEEDERESAEEYRGLSPNPMMSCATNSTTPAASMRTATTGSPTARTATTGLPTARTATQGSPAARTAPECLRWNLDSISPFCKDPSATHTATNGAAATRTAATDGPAASQTETEGFLWNLGGLSPLCREALGIHSFASLLLSPKPFCDRQRMATETGSVSKETCNVPKEMCNLPKETSNMPTEMRNTPKEWSPSMEPSFDSMSKWISAPVKGSCASRDILAPHNVPKETYTAAKERCSVSNETCNASNATSRDTLAPHNVPKEPYTVPNETYTAAKERCSVSKETCNASNATSNANIAASGAAAAAWPARLPRGERAKGSCASPENGVKDPSLSLSLSLSPEEGVKDLCHLPHLLPLLATGSCNGEGGGGGGSLDADSPTIPADSSNIPAPSTLPKEVVEVVVVGGDTPEGTGRNEMWGWTRMKDLPATPTKNVLNSAQKEVREVVDVRVWMLTAPLAFSAETADQRQGLRGVQDKHVCVSLSFSLALARALSLALSLAFVEALALSLSRALSRSLSQTHSLFLSFLVLSHSLSLSLSFSRSSPLTCSLSLSLPIYLSPPPSPLSSLCFILSLSPPPRPPPSLDMAAQ